MKVKDLVEPRLTLDQEKEIIAVRENWMSSCNNLIPAILYEPGTIPHSYDHNTGTWVVDGYYFDL